MIYFRVTTSLENLETKNRQGIKIRQVKGESRGNVSKTYAQDEAVGFASHCRHLVKCDIIHNIVF